MPAFEAINMFDKTNIKTIAFWWFIVHLLSSLLQL